MFLALFCWQKSWFHQITTTFKSFLRWDLFQYYCSAEEIYFWLYWVNFGKASLTLNRKTLRFLFKDKVYPLLQVYSVTTRRQVTFSRDLIKSSQESVLSKEFYGVNSLNRLQAAKESQNGCYKKTKQAKFSENQTFLTPWYAYVSCWKILWTRIRGKLEKLGVLCFPVTTVLRFFPLPYCRRVNPFVHSVKKWSKYLRNLAMFMECFNITYEWVNKEVWT